MRRKDKKITDKDIILEILQTANICRIAIHTDDYPYIVPMNYGYKDNIIYLHSASSGRKLDLLKQNNKVGFEIEQGHEIIKDKISCRWTTKYRSIIGFGDIEFINDKAQKLAGLTIIMEHHGKKDNIFSKKAVESVLVLKLQSRHYPLNNQGNGNILYNYLMTSYNGLYIF